MGDQRRDRLRRVYHLWIRLTYWLVPASDIAVTVAATASIATATPITTVAAVAATTRSTTLPGYLLRQHV